MIPLLELGLDVEFDEAVKAMMRTDGIVNSISICGSGLLEVTGLPTGRLAARRGFGIAGIEEAMTSLFQQLAFLRLPGHHGTISCAICSGEWIQTLVTQLDAVCRASEKLERAESK